MLSRYYLHEYGNMDQSKRLSMRGKIDRLDKGLFPYYIISYNKQGSFQMITKDYSKGPRVVRKDYILWKIQNMQESASMSASSSQSQLR